MNHCHDPPPPPNPQSYVSLSPPPQALEQYLFPHLKTYWNQLRQVLDDSSQSNTMLQEEACQVYGALLVWTSAQ